MNRFPQRGDVYTVQLDPVIGHEQRGVRPALVISHDVLNQGPAGLVVLVPITSKDKGQVLHVRVNPPEAGLIRTSFIKCEDLRSVSQQRLLAHLGAVTAKTLAQVEDRLRVLLVL